MSAALYSEDDEDDFLSSLRTRSGSSSSTLSSRPNTCERAEAAERSDRYKLAVEVLRTVYHEFYDEHVRLAQEEIDKLKFSNEPLLEESPWITFFNSTDGEEQVIQLGEVHTIILENAFDDSEELYYYCCAPASQNMEELEFFTNFVPHADAPEFDLDEFLAWDEDARDSFSFPWQNLEDPDRDIIDVEVARILHYKHQFTFKEIDKLGLLRLSLRGPNDNPESGLIWMNSQRETIEWQSSCSAKLQLPRFPTNFSHGTLLETINAGVYHFCANPNCITSHCATHYTGDIRKRITQPFEPCEPKETQEGILLKYANLNPCSKFCFMTHLNEETIETSIWRAEDEQELRELLAFIPDANPCDLAVMCRKRCYEVYFHRKNIYPDNEILKRRYNENLERRNATLVSPLPRDLSEFENRVDGLGNPILDSSHNPCIHQGSCGTEAPNCSCYTSRHYCRRECRCPQDCPYRIPGCHCKVKKGIACNTTRCPCREAGRECDPERCISCDARACGYNGITNCRNVRMQQEQHSQFQIEIKPSERHGNGAFACKSARKNQLIGEYVGEIQGRNTTDEYQIINNFRELNYIFDFKEFEVLNSATMGNELRYLNHDSEIFNCKPEMMQVNGDLRIGIVSTKYIKKGEELFLDYGEQYWSKTD